MFTLYPFLFVTLYALVSVYLFIQYYYYCSFCVDRFVFFLCCVSAVFFLIKCLDSPNWVYYNFSYFSLEWGRKINNNNNNTRNQRKYQTFLGLSVGFILCACVCVCLFILFGCWLRPVQTEKRWNFTQVACYTKV